VRPSLVLVAVLGLATFGCGRVREVRQCRALANLVNPALDEISNRVDKDKSAAPYRFAARRYAKLAADLKAYQLGIPRAQKTVEELSVVLRDAGTQSAKLAEALEKSDTFGAANARRDLSQLARQQRTITLRLSGDCSGT
jgi:hypothetical protein